jgi:hypothetical protein
LCLPPVVESWPSEKSLVYKGPGIQECGPVAVRRPVPGSELNEINSPMAAKEFT